MVREDIDRLWHDEQVKQQRQHERRVALLVSLAFALGIVLLSWWTKV